ncbi:MAG: transglycosylase domain-containing protein [Clostridia bacterium]|nr:transglycosylase domain-containing protein [Clostridia bacterium]MDD4386922.1 transglycosylase domain-containing protein [Clostridia bacterium]
MKSLKNIIKKIIILIIIIVILIVGKIFIDGYNMYEQAINKTSLSDKTKQIRSSNDYVKIGEMTEDYKNAVIAIEDHRFIEHGGIDYISTFRAVIKNLKVGELAEGGSTITQQLAKNMYFTQEKKFERKVAELFIAFKLEKEYSKDDILEMYINIMYFGNGYYGIGKASKGYLYKEPIEMTLYESTLLAGLPNAPSVYALNSNPALAKERQNQVLDCMVKYNYLTEVQAQEVKNLK